MSGDEHGHICNGDPYWHMAVVLHLAYQGYLSTLTDEEKASEQDTLNGQRGLGHYVSTVFTDDEGDDVTRNVWLAFADLWNTNQTNAKFEELMSGLEGGDHGHV